MKTKLLTICLILSTLLTSNVFSKNHQEIIGVWHITDNTGGIGVFDRATLKRIIIFQDKNLYLAVSIGYNWGDHDSWKTFTKKEYFDIEMIDEDIDKCEVQNPHSLYVEFGCYSEKGDFFYDPRNIKKDKDGHYNEYRDEGVEWNEYIEFLPTSYLEYNVSDFDSAEHFISNMTKEFCSVYDEYDKCYLSNEYKFDLTTQNKIIDCIQKNKNEVLSEEQKKSRIENYENPNIPEIWSCIYPDPSKKLFKKRQLIKRK